jgi:hypothetical protein
MYEAIRSTADAPADYTAFSALSVLATLGFMALVIGVLCLLYSKGFKRRPKYPPDRLD